MRPPKAAADKYHGVQVRRRHRQQAKASRAPSYTKVFAKR
jgi:hypothetical protein